MTRTNSLYVATGDAFTAPAAPESDAIVAFDLDTGRTAMGQTVDA